MAAVPWLSRWTSPRRCIEDARLFVNPRHWLTWQRSVVFIAVYNKSVILLSKWVTLNAAPCTYHIPCISWIMKWLIISDARWKHEDWHTLFAEFTLFFLPFLQRPDIWSLCCWESLIATLTFPLCVRCVTVTQPSPLTVSHQPLFAPDSKSLSTKPEVKSPSLSSSSSSGTMYSLIRYIVCRWPSQATHISLCTPSNNYNLYKKGEDRWRRESWRKNGNLNCTCGYKLNHTTPAEPHRNTNTRRTRYVITHTHDIRIDSGLHTKELENHRIPQRPIFTETRLLKQSHTSRLITRH